MRDVLQRAILPCRVAEGTSGAWVALLGRRDEPTDALEDYCLCLKAALIDQRVPLSLLRVPWHDLGWWRASRWLRNECSGWSGRWVLVQYTALGWSRRGFPLRLLQVVSVLKRRGAHVALVFHDPTPFEGSRVRDQVRRATQVAIMRRAAQRADRVITTVAPDCVPWLWDPGILKKMAHISVGGNVPVRLAAAPSGIPTVVVFGVTERKREEAELIAQVIRKARDGIGPVRLVVLGRGAPEAEPALRERLAGSDVAIEVDGVLPANAVSDRLAAAHAQLFVRAGVSSRRGSAVAGICSGLPLIAFSDQETGFPITKAGVRLVPKGDVEGLTRELVLVLTNEQLRLALSQRSLEAARRFFSWNVIAERFLDALGPGYSQSSHAPVSFVIR